MFNVKLSQPATSAIKVTYATSNGTATSGEDYTAATGTVAFAAGESSKPISVKVFGDSVVEPDEVFHVTLTGVTSGPAILDLSPSADATITNDDVTAVATIHDAQVVEGNTGTRNIVFTVTLSQPATGAVKLTYATSNGTATAGADYVAASGTITFAVGVTSKTFSVAVVGDRTPEPDETFNVVLTGVTQGPAVIGPASAQGTITNND